VEEYIQVDLQLKDLAREVSTKRKLLSALDVLRCTDLIQDSACVVSRRNLPVNLVTPYLGTHFPSNVETIWWTKGYQTALPFIRLNDADGDYVTHFQVY